MRTYISFSAKAFSKQLAYRSEVWLRLLGNFVTILIQAEIWRAVIGHGHVEGITVEQMITYSIINTLLMSLLLHGISGKVDESLKSGSIASELIKPISYPLFLLFDELGNTIYQLLFTVFPTFIIALFYFGMVPPASLTHFLVFLIALLIALIISFLIGYLISLLAFWFMNHFALSWMLRGFITIFSGTFLPIWFFPSSWVTVANLLPFQYMGYIPAAIYLGSIPVQELFMIIVAGGGWIVGLLILVQLLWTRAVRRLVVQGG